VYWYGVVVGVGVGDVGVVVVGDVGVVGGVVGGVAGCVGGGGVVGGVVVVVTNTQEHGKSMPRTWQEHGKNMHTHIHKQNIWMWLLAYAPDTYHGDTHQRLHTAWLE
jgi:hypothetical protein